MAYIDKNDGGGAPTPATGCVFCEKAASEDPASDLVLFRGESAYVLMNLFPYNNGHLMIAPLAHTNRYEELPEATLLEMGTLSQRAMKMLAAAIRPDGYNTGMNLGSIAGAGIAGHLHLHIVPRWSGDVNFMPVVGETKVLPESLSNTYRKLLHHWE